MTAWKRSRTQSGDTEQKTCFPSSAERRKNPGPVQTRGQRIGKRLDFTAEGSLTRVSSDLASEGSISVWTIRQTGDFRHPSSEGTGDTQTPARRERNSLIAPSLRGIPMSGASSRDIRLSPCSRISGGDPGSHLLHRRSLRLPRRRGRGHRGPEHRCPGRVYFPPRFAIEGSLDYHSPYFDAFRRSTYVFFRWSNQRSRSGAEPATPGPSDFAYPA